MDNRDRTDKNYCPRCKATVRPIFDNGNWYCPIHTTTSTKAPESFADAYYKKQAEVAGP